MKIGDIVFSTKIRPGENAKIINAEVVTKMKDTKNGKKKEVRTTYIAEYPDGSTMTFYGFNINKSIFAYVKPDGQMCLDDFLGECNDGRNEPCEFMNPPVEG